jgi:hypothetical protein
MSDDEGKADIPTVAAAQGSPVEFDPLRHSEKYS